MGAKNQIKDCKGNYHKPKLKLAHFIDVMLAFLTKLRSSSVNTYV